ncbi:RCC1 domain-containing protein [Luedemannella flava]
MHNTDQHSRPRRWRRLLARGSAALVAVVTGVVAMISGAGPAAAAAPTWWQIGTGHAFTCGIQAGGSLWCWGINDHGNLGVGDTDRRDRPTRVGTSYAWVQLTVNTYSVCATNTSGRAYCWGSNYNGTLGVNSSAVWVTTPTELKGGISWDVLSMGSEHTCGIANHALYCWGANDWGQLGHGNENNIVTTPTRVGTDSDWLSVSAGSMHTCALS